MANTYELDMTEYTQEDVDSVGAGQFVDRPGWYHAICEKVEHKDDGQKSPSYAFTFRVLAGKPDGQKGATITDHLYLTPKTRDRQVLFAKRLGLIGNQHAGKAVSIDWDNAIGRQVAIQVVEEEIERNGQKSGEKRCKLAFNGIHTLDDPKVKDVPRDAAAVAATGQRPAASQPAAVGAGADKFADL